MSASGPHQGPKENLAPLSREADWVSHRAGSRLPAPHPTGGRPRPAPHAPHSSWAGVPMPNSWARGLGPGASPGLSSRPCPGCTPRPASAPGTAGRRLTGRKRRRGSQPLAPPCRSLWRQTWHVSLRPARLPASLPPPSPLLPPPSQRRAEGRGFMSEQTGEERLTRALPACPGPRGGEPGPDPVDSPWSPACPTDGGRARQRPARGLRGWPACPRGPRRLPLAADRAHGRSEPRWEGAPCSGRVEVARAGVPALPEPP